ncbi:hypothetical protein Back2_06810 [Nocardioides baekrokdamisoli]|uniref:Peptidase S24/S26A/S26B/S26C domain-containing protein n=1 Tax=Nocardioides baekrokdamisoli TaxID=1804624 RepID=A0A3G9IYX8_9ACTN|nr:S24/S26 family peptidase [Nocardioides baekrokdamisoli]BBH16394.1 hypothetical protein Back2_06810 [Nocardioides baekrokdamisoli]
MSQTYSGVPRRDARFGFAIVHGRSMEPTLRAGDRLLIAYRGRPRVGNLVVAAFPDGVRAVKRITAKRETGWWLSSDNADHGVDSRHRGPLEDERIRAVVRARVWPRPRLFTAG